MSGNSETKAKRKYNRNNYDQFLTIVKKGEKATLQQHAAEMGESLNAWITGAIKRRYYEETGQDEIPKADETS